MRNLKIADVEVIAEDCNIGGLVHESAAIQTSHKISDIRVDHEDGSTDGVNYDHETIRGRGEAGRNVDEADADAVCEFTALVKNLRKNNNPSVKIFADRVM